MKTNIYPSLQFAICNNPAIAAAHGYWQDDGFGTLIDTITMGINDVNRTCYLYAFLERDHLMVYNPLFYGIH